MVILQIKPAELFSERERLSKCETVHAGIFALEIEHIVVCCNL